MNLIKSPSLVLQKIPYSESSLILKVYTRDCGLVTLMAKGAHRPRSKFRGLLDVFNLNQFVFNERSGAEIYILQEAGLIVDFPRLKAHPGRNALAHVFLEVYLRYIHGTGPSFPLYELLVESLDSLDAVETSQRDHVQHLCDFLLGFCAASGFSPQFRLCVHCHTEVRSIKSPMNMSLGGPVCSQCQSREGESHPVVKDSLLKWMARIQLEGVHAGHASKSDELQGEALLLSFIARHCGGEKRLKSLDFYREMGEMADVPH